MSKFNNEKVMPRYMAIAIVMTLIGFAVIGKALYIMTAKKQYWTEVADRLKRDSVSVKPTRGNILSCDGQLMATSIPEYKIFMDFQGAAFEIDSLWLDKVDSICEGLNRIRRLSSNSIWKPVGTRSTRTDRWEPATGLSGPDVSTTIPIWKSDSCHS